MDLIETLVADHRLMDRVLSAFEEFASRAEIAGKMNLAELNRFCVFFRDFVELVHHDREENGLLPAMERLGYARESAALEHIRRQHREERRMLLDLRQAATAHRQPADLQLARLITAARKLVAFERAHIKQENELLYPAVKRELAGKAFTADDHGLRHRSDAEYHATEEEWLRRLGEELIRHNAQ